MTCHPRAIPKLGVVRQSERDDLPLQATPSESQRQEPQVKRLVIQNYLVK